MPRDTTASRACVCLLMDTPLEIARRLTHRSGKNCVSHFHFSQVRIRAQPCDFHLQGGRATTRLLLAMLLATATGFSASVVSQSVDITSPVNPFLVTTTADGGVGSLRGAIAGANRQPGTETNT